MKPGDLVLVRDSVASKWNVSVYGYRLPSGVYVCANGVHKEQCIPLESNELLVGTYHTPSYSSQCDNANDYVQKQDDWLAETGCKPNSVVLITATAKRGQLGWAATWAEGMDDKVGQYGIVEHVAATKGCGIRVRFHADSWVFPYFVLKVVRA